MNAIPKTLEGLIEHRPERVDEATPSARERHAVLLRAMRAELIARRQASVLGVITEMLDEADLQRSLDAFAGALQRRFAAARVTVAIASERGVLRLGAISQRTLVEAGSADVRLLLEAMEEAALHEGVVRFPRADDSLGILQAHQSLLAGRPCCAAASVPLFHDGRLVGAFLLERDDSEAFAPPTLASIEQLALVAAPLLALRREAGRGGLARWRHDTSELVKRRFGAEQVATRWLLLPCLALLALVLLIPVDRNLHAAAELVPHERRLVTSPVAGFVDEVLVGAGEHVEPGQLLARLDRRELELEAAREDSEVAAAEAELRAAMASHDRQASAVARARVEQERAQRALVDHRLARSELRAPVGGLIASGDPLEIVGAPITRGERLFEIVPDDGYEVHLLVDAADIRDVREGQGGELALQSRPGESLPLIVKTIHPVAESGGGGNRFRVRAELTDIDGDLLRPGETGSARLPVGRTTLIGRFVEPLRKRLSALYWRYSA